MFILDTETRNRYKTFQKALTDTYKGKVVEIDKEYFYHNRRKDKLFNINKDMSRTSKRFNIVKIIPSQTRFFNCGYIEDLVEIKNIETQYKTIVIFDHLKFID